jgi:uncharacterized membrane protein
VYPTILAAFLLKIPTVAAMCCAGVVVLLIAALAARRNIAGARGLDEIAALSTVCFAAPLAVFGAEHVFGIQLVIDLVPKFMPWPLFWAYFVGFALLAASLSIATKIAVRWSGLLLGIMMFLFVAMIHFPNALQDPRNVHFWVICFRELSFGGAAWILAGNAMDGWRGQGKGVLITVGRVLIGIAAIFFGVEHFLHPHGLPGVPLPRQMPSWVPAQALIDYVTGVALLAGGITFLLSSKARTAAALVGGWILLTVLVIYGPVMIGALRTPTFGAQVEGVNYFFDTLFYAGAILVLASASLRQAPS